MPQKTLIIGIGNPFLTDDGIGPFLVDYLKLRLPASYLFKKEIDLDFADLEDMRGFDTVIIIDAFMQNKSLGTISVIKVPALENRPDMISTHGQNLFDILSLGRIYRDFPEAIYLIGVEVKDPYTWHEGFSDELNKKLDEITGEVYRIILQLVDYGRTV